MEHWQFRVLNVDSVWHADHGRRSGHEGYSDNAKLSVAWALDSWSPLANKLWEYAPGASQVRMSSCHEDLYLLT
jgi:hypothetical protein